MRRDLINEDSNQFGPGTDLTICLLALLMVFVMIVSYLYGNEKNKVQKLETAVKELTDKNTTLNDKNIGLKKELEKGGKFEHAGEFNGVGTFEPKPFWKLKDPAGTEEKVLEIIEKYNTLKDKFPFIFVIGHSSTVGLAGKPNLPEEERIQYNWEFARSRSIVIANLIQKNISEDEKNNIVVISTGEFDLKNPEYPTNEENAYVEVLFGNEWKTINKDNEDK